MQCRIYTHTYIYIYIYIYLFIYFQFHTFGILRDLWISCKWWEIEHSSHQIGRILALSIGVFTFDLDTFQMWWSTCTFCFQIFRKRWQIEQILLLSECRKSRIGFRCHVCIGPYLILKVKSRCHAYCGRKYFVNGEW